VGAQGLTPGAAAGTVAPAYYAGGRGWWRDVRAVLHPPYTAWHLSYVVLGACCARRVSWSVLAATLVAFFLAVGIAAHAFDELRGRPLGTTISSSLLAGGGSTALAGAVALGVLGVARVGPWLLAFVAVGTALVLAYNLELFGGRIHTDLGFALSWGAFPVLTASFAESRTIPPAAIALAGAAALLSAAQRSLSTWARTLRRRTASVSGVLTTLDGSVVELDRATLLAPVERALRLLPPAMVLLAGAFALVRAQGG
jgi:hypothetical protein